MRRILIACIVLAAAEAQADETDNRAVVVHAPQTSAHAGKPIPLIAVIDNAWVESELVLYFRGTKRAVYHQRPFERAADGSYRATIPGSVVQPPAIHYYIGGKRMDGAAVEHFGSSTAPHLVHVEAVPSRRWITEERSRLNQRMDRFALVAEGIDFGNRFGNEDRFARAELTWIHRLVTTLYAVHMGFGMIEGDTPNGNDAESASEPRGARYGFGGVTLRAHKSVSIDARALLGFSRDGFIIGGAGQLTLGRPWRSCVNLGGEAFEDMKSSLWVRLQWDTVPPFLMGAAIFKTDLPGAPVSGGSYFVYDLSYPVTEQLWLGAKLFYGSRDGPGRGGGGLTMAVNL